MFKKYRQMKVEGSSSNNQRYNATTTLHKKTPSRNQQKNKIFTDTSRDRSLLHQNKTQDAQTMLYVTQRSKINRTVRLTQKSGNSNQRTQSPLNKFHRPGKKEEPEKASLH